LTYDDLYCVVQGHIYFVHNALRSCMREPLAGCAMTMCCLTSSLRKDLQQVCSLGLVFQVGH
jgi:hypothetical protein